ncbi:Haloacid dehalogenase-like hydrolase, partial [Dillenia turbinata]
FWYERAFGQDGVQLKQKLRRPSQAGKGMMEITITKEATVTEPKTGMEMAHITVDLIKMQCRISKPPETWCHIHEFHIHILYGSIANSTFGPPTNLLSRMSWKELMECKHPTAGVEFEKGLIDEVYFAKCRYLVNSMIEFSVLNKLAKKFKDGRPFDLEGLKNCMSNGYVYLEGVEALLHDLKQNDYEIHAFTNYPDKLKLSNYLSWTFASCKSGLRKPDPDFYLEVLSHLEVETSSCIFVDDRLKNVVGAKNAGMVGLLFTNAELLRQDLSSLGIDISMDNHPYPAKLAGQ